MTPFRTTTLRLSSALAALLLLAAPAQAAAEGTGDADAGIEGADAGLDAPIYETVVRGARPDDEGLSRAAITRDDIARSGATTIAEALEDEPSIHASTGRRGERIVTIRGFDQRGVAVTFDGVPLSIPYDGRLDLGKLPTALVGRVLVVKGPGSIVHGPGGMGGSVVVETRDPESSPLAEATAEIGEGSARSLSGFHAWSGDGLSYAIAAGGAARSSYGLSDDFAPTRNEDGGARENSDRALRYAGGVLSLRPGGGHGLTSEAFVVDGDLAVPPSATDSFPRYWRFGIWRTAVGKVSHSFRRGGVHLDEAVWAGVFDNRLDSYDDATYSTMETPRAFSSWYHDRNVGGRVLAEVFTRRGRWGKTALRLWVGANQDWHRQRLDLNQEESSHSRALVTIVPEAEVPLPAELTLLVSAQTDIELPNSPSGDDPAAQAQPGPLVALRWDPLDSLMIRLSGARRARIPTLKERFSSAFGSSEPNPDLRSEIAWYTGLDATWRPGGGLSIALSGFDAEVLDLIDLVPIGDGLEQQENVGRARLAGAEAEIGWAIGERVDLTAGYAFLHARRLDASPPDDRLEYLPAHRASFDVAVRPLRPLELGTSLRIVGPQAFQDREVLSWGELGAYYLWDARLVAAIRGARLWIRVTNILDSNYQTEYGFPDPGRELWLGASISLDRAPREEEP